MSTRPAAFDFGSLPEYELLKMQKAAGEIAGIDNPFYRLHDGRAADTSSIDGRTLTNFSSYDYLGLNGHPDVVAAAKAAIDEFGTSVSASRLTAGERRVHRDLEERQRACTERKMLSPSSAAMPPTFRSLEGSWALMIWL
jgi:7-keto-8-aminopelargonate synthetase-like enzyme